MTMASLRAAGLPEPSIRVPLRTTRVFLPFALIALCLNLLAPVRAHRPASVARAMESKAIAEPCKGFRRGGAARRLRKTRRGHGAFVARGRRGAPGDNDRQNRAGRLSQP